MSKVSPAHLPKEAGCEDPAAAPSPSAGCDTKTLKQGYSLPLYTTVVYATARTLPNQRIHVRASKIIWNLVVSKKTASHMYLWSWGFAVALDNLFLFVQGDWMKAGPPYPTWQWHKGEQVALLTLWISRHPQRTVRKPLGSGWTIRGISPTTEHINTRECVIVMILFKYSLFLW